MEYWTYKKASTKVKVDQDLQDQIFIGDDEMRGYFNEAIKDAFAEIMLLNQDYFLKSAPLPLVEGKAEYPYPWDIFARKIRGIEYSNGTIIYPVGKFRNLGKFDSIAFANQYTNTNEDYRWYAVNPKVGQDTIVLVPPARETAVVPPNANPFTPMIVWYLREPGYIPLLGEWIKMYEQFLPAAVDPAADTIELTETYVTGDRIKFTTTGVLPGGIPASGIAFVIKTATPGVYQLATTLALAKANNPLDITSAGSGVSTIQIAATVDLINNTLIDIPEYIDYVLQFVKCRALDKEGDPRLKGATETLERLRQNMVSSLTQAEPDNEDQIQMDLSNYTDMS